MSDEPTPTPGETFPLVRRHDGTYVNGNTGEVMPYVFDGPPPVTPTLGARRFSPEELAQAVEHEAYKARVNAESVAARGYEPNYAEGEADRAAALSQAAATLRNLDTERKEQEEVVAMLREYIRTDTMPTSGLHKRARALLARLAGERTADNTHTG